ncbi:F0F1 ATP synthase subunit delta [Pontibacillus marinus]|uniref:ATP synthase subunit delta n=1 Tax=Pontibacillus marinus BH030004 = DSM 16465 TaxID=1385511 RepID=A0A0A5G7Y2_9BACI|nr:F0F1 ATP synthase subunit delta [Pontibacillus marinus]KGX87283.1 F0F1 ATP synthase subunit delta [Pontibacillus marinus BH030004 = DSM 16465]
MSNEIVAKRYATALFQIGQEQSKLEQFEDELTTIREVFRSNEKLHTFLQHPAVELDQKKNMIHEAFKGVSKEVMHTLDILLDRHREGVIPTMVNEFVKRTNEARGIADADVYSVRELSEEEQKSIQSVFTQKLNKKAIRIHNIVDPSILGGLKLKIGNRIYDGSVSNQLQRIERKLTSGNK